MKNNIEKANEELKKELDKEIAGKEYNNYKNDNKSFEDKVINSFDTDLLMVQTLNDWRLR